MHEQGRAASQASRAVLDRDDEALFAALSATVPREGAVSTRSFDRVVAAVDASHYLRTPRAVVSPESVEEIKALFRAVHDLGQTLTFRSGGTSLSGQASTDGILVDTRRNFRSISVGHDGLVVRAGAGATVRQVNARLLRFGRKLGPDPASEIACTIGGVVANNSSGMACGTEQNAYRTLRSAVIVLPSGTVIDSGASDANQKFEASEPQLCEILSMIRRRLLARPDLTDEIVRQFSIKNTMGYGLNAFIDYESPVDILTHLIVGSEGTLGFVAEATFNTVPLLRHSATALLLFETLTAATDALVDIVGTKPATVELMDAASLRAALIDPASRVALPNVEFVGHCALLVEYQARTPDGLEELKQRATHLIQTFELTAAPVLSDDAATRASLWRIRKGLYATIAGARPSGTTALLEDIAVPVDRLSSTCSRLTELFDIHGYQDAVIFGHAKDGNIHFLLNEDFNIEANVVRYRAFTEDLVDLVLTAGGTLKAEHGTGRIMAPFVSRQYGPELFEIMVQIKAAIDPRGFLNPDAIITADPHLHLRDLKSTPRVESEVDRCVECGYCEPVCPSKDLTTTPRQRIVARRAIADAENRGDTQLARELRRDEQYHVIDTCAVDGMCETACPVLINTGDLVRRLRAESVSPLVSGAWNAAGRVWRPATAIASVALDVAATLPAPLVTASNRAARSLFGEDNVPLWSEDLPRGGSRRRGGSTGPDPAAVYFSACVGTMFGPAVGEEGVAVAFQSLAQKAGLELVQPAKIGSLCCGTPWKSKGITRGYAAMRDQTLKALWDASQQGRLPVVCDNSSCTEGLELAREHSVEDHPEYAAMRIVDAIDFTAEFILPELRLDNPLSTLAVHPTCSSTRAGSNPNLLRIANAIAVESTIPNNWGCCGFAGDRGMLHPELTATATRAEARDVSAQEFDAYVSCNRTCEIGMTRATGHPYQHILEVLDARSL